MSLVIRRTPILKFFINDIEFNLSSGTFTDYANAPILAIATIGDTVNIKIVADFSEQLSLLDNTNRQIYINEFHQAATASILVRLYKCDAAKTIPADSDYIVPTDITVEDGSGTITYKYDNLLIDGSRLHFRVKKYKTKVLQANAESMIEQARHNVLEQAAEAQLEQARGRNQSVLSLLQ